MQMSFSIFGLFFGQFAKEQNNIPNVFYVYLLLLRRQEMVTVGINSFKESAKS